MNRNFVVIAAVLGAVGVVLGAFGAHGLSAILTVNGHTDTFHTATQYQMIHALALLGVAVAAQQWPGKLMQWAGYLFLAGVVLFSGSLYLLAIFDLSWLGAVAPLGGVALIGGWVCLGWAAWRNA
ncbi:MAG: DUF423 domain-containing protein [Anaerolineae bacterium]|nr:DUF423 domain-containing protein [Anaerolineae bacterium]